MAPIKLKDIMWICASATSVILFVVFIDTIYPWINKLVAFFFIALVAFVHIQVAYNNSHYKKEFFALHENVALVIAHPDDEVMFFSPALFALRDHVNFHIVCVTTGNYYGQGKLRHHELAESCHIFGIPRHRIIFIKDHHFRDHPTERWDVALLAEKLNTVMTSHNITTIMTFSQHGVSGHSNHCDVHTAVTLMSDYQRIYLTDVNLLRKYSSLLDCLYTYCSADEGSPVFFSTHFARTFAAMRKHKSQFVWFRALYLLFSRYVLVNEFHIQLPTQ